MSLRIAGCWMLPGALPQLACYFHPQHQQEHTNENSSKQKQLGYVLVGQLAME